MDEVRLINANALCQHIQDWKTRCQELHRHSVGMYHMMIYEVLCKVLDVINDTPTIDLESLRPTAKWIIVRRMADGAECKCGNCGRKEVLQHSTGTRTMFIAAAAGAKWKQRLESRCAKMTMTPCKDCPTRHPVCHDTCPKYAEFKLQHIAELAYTKQMTDRGVVYHYDHEDRHRERGRKKYMGANGGADR